MERLETVTEDNTDREDVVSSEMLDIVLSALNESGTGSVSKASLESQLASRLFVQYNPIRVLRVRKGVSQKDLAEDSQCSHVTLGQFEGGKSLPRISQLYEVAIALDEDPATLAFKYMSWYAHLKAGTYKDYMQEPYTEGS